VQYTLYQMVWGGDLHPRAHTHIDVRAQCDTLETGPLSLSFSPSSPTNQKLPDINFVNA